MLTKVLLLTVIALTCDAQQTGFLGKLFEKCFEDIGCFKTGPPFGLIPPRILPWSPESPEEIQTRFLLYTVASKNKPQDLQATQVKTNLQKAWPGFGKRPTKIVVHGFTDGVNESDWQKEMKDELLRQGDYNVILVDWSLGAGQILRYDKAVDNTRIVGAQIGFLINTLIKTYNVLARDFHIIGHSLGAHIAGYAGERVVGLGRISGLDPAGQLFMGFPNSVKLDASDALFVDVIHTDMLEQYVWSFGIPEAVGHADFYPNSGRHQPGCIASSIKNFKEFELVNGTTELIACSHRRAYKLFTESINSSCRFKSFPCDKFYKNSFTAFIFSNLKTITTVFCKRCGVLGCTNMGFWADKKTASGTYFVETSGESPFCLRN